ELLDQGPGRVGVEVARVALDEALGVARGLLDKVKAEVDVAARLVGSMALERATVLVGQIADRQRVELRVASVDHLDGALGLLDQVRGRVGSRESSAVVRGALWELGRLGE